MPRKDFAQLALSVVRKATGAEPRKRKGNQRAGGLKGGKARANALSKKRRAEIAKVAASARWKKG
jgi:hypothetical protein